MYNFGKERGVCHMQIGNRLAELRRKYKYTQKQLAEALRLSQQIVSNIERNTTAPDLEFLKGVADLYKISLDELVGRTFDLPMEKSYERKMLELFEVMTEEEKELSLRLVGEVVQHNTENKK